MDDETKYFEDIRTIVESFKALSKSALPAYTNITEDIINDRITDINEIERTLDYMLDLCFDDEILLLYKAILRKLYPKYPNVVASYIKYYFEMYESDESKDEDEI
jgi:hypothetical protein